MSTKKPFIHDPGSNKASERKLKIQENDLGAVLLGPPA